MDPSASKRLTGMKNEAPRPPTEIELSLPAGELEVLWAQSCGAAETEAHGNQRVGPEGWPKQESGCRADAAVRKSMHPAHTSVGSATSRGGRKHFRNFALTGFKQVREQALQRATAT